MSIFSSFDVADDREDFDKIDAVIRKGVVFRGTNLWIFIFSIFTASLGLNVNSAAVVIGAMLISPLMGPIIGLGFGMAINDLSLLKRSLLFYSLAAIVGLATSTLYFFVSPINDAHSEILARTSPNIYDVLIALFGGLAGIFAISSKMKGNVLPGVAIATALMPPLCSAGYGLATLQFGYFLGALYLFVINTVFIALATFVTARLFKFPFMTLPTIAAERRSRRIVFVVVVVTLLPSLYLGYNMVQQDKFRQRAIRFIEIEAVFPNDFLLKKVIDVENRVITLTYGGQLLNEKDISLLRSKMSMYELDSSSLVIQQGFAYLGDDKTDKQAHELSLVLSARERVIQQLQERVDTLAEIKRLSQQVHIELRSQFPNVYSSTLQQSILHTDTTDSIVWVSLIRSRPKLNSRERATAMRWLNARLTSHQVFVSFE